MIYTNSVAAPREELTDVIMEGVTDTDEFVGLKILPAAPLRLANGHVPKITIGKGNLMRATAKARSPGADFDRWQAAIEDHSVALLQISEELSIPDEVSMSYEDYFDLEQIYSQEAGNRLLRGIELDAEATLFNTGNFDSNNGGAAYSVANLATMTPVADIFAAIRLVKGRGEKPNTILFPGTVFDRVRQSTDMKSYIAGSINPGARVTQGTIQQAFAEMGIKQVLVSDSYVNQSQDGLTNSINPIFPLSYIFVGNATPGNLRAGGVGRTFYWEKEGPLLNISSYRDEPKKSNIIRAMKTTLTDITNARAGTLIATQVTT